MNMFNGKLKTSKIEQRKLDQLGMSKLEGALFSGLSELGSKHGININNLNIEIDKDATEDEKINLMKKRLELFNIVQAYVGYYAIGTFVNPQGEEQPYYDILGKKIYLGPEDFWGSKNIVPAVGGLLHETLHVHLTKGNSHDIIDFVFDKEKPGFSHLMNVVEDIRINNIAEQTIEYGSEYIKYKYKDLYYVKSLMEYYKGDEKAYLDNIMEGNKKYKKLAVNSILHYYGILAIGDKNINDTEYDLIQKSLKVLENMYPDDYEYLTKKMDECLEKYGDYTQIEFNVRDSYEAFVDVIYNDIYLKYQESFEQKTSQEEEEEFMKKLGEMLGEKLGEMQKSQKGQLGQGGGKPQPGQGSGQGQLQEKGEGKSEKKQQGQGGGGQGDDKGPLKKNNVGSDGKVKNPDKLSKEKGLGKGGKDGKDGNNKEPKEKSAIEKLMEAAKKQAEINEQSGGSGRSLEEVENQLNKELNTDKYETIKNGISYKITDFVTRLRKVLFEKKKNVTQRGLNSGTSVNGGRLIKNVMETEFGSREKYEVLSGVFERRIAPGKIPNYYFGVAIDNSGSMQGENMEEAIKTGVLLIEVFRALKIPFMLYSYNSSFINIYDFNNGTLKNAKKVTSITPSGGTDEIPLLNELENKLEKIYVKPSDRSNTNKIIFIITDGESGDETTRKIEMMRKKGYTVYGIGIGKGVRESSIREIYGKYGIYCPDVANLSKEITKKIGELYIK